MYKHQALLIKALIVSCLSCCLLWFYSAPVAAEILVAPGIEAVRSNLQDQQALALTIYNDNLALVKDQRKVKLKLGENTLAISDVSAQMRPETATLRSVSALDSIVVSEQSVDLEQLSPQKLLEQYVGKSVRVIKTNPVSGLETTEQAELLSANNGVILKIGNQIETSAPGRIVYDAVPDNVHNSPTLVIQLKNKDITEQTLELSYLTSGLTWQADYVAILNANDNALDLSGWITLNNTSGTAYKNAKLQLVAGDINRAQSLQPVMMNSIRSKDNRMSDSAPMAEESLLEYHLYNLDHQTTLAGNQTKQVALLSTSSVPVHSEMVLQGADYYYQSAVGELGNKLKIGIFMQFENKAETHLGMPLPKGIVRVYQKDSAGNLQFVGEDGIDHTAKNQTIRLKLGDAFDINAEKKQTDFKKLTTPGKDIANYESAYQIVLENAKKEAVNVTVKEPVPGEWKILNENYPSQKTSSNNALWHLDVPAEGKTVLNYRVQVKY